MDLQTITYDGVVLPYCQVSYSGRAEYDDTGRILQGYTLTFKCSCVVSSTAAGVNGSGGSAGNVTGFLDNLYRILDVLSHPQRTFKWTSGGVTVFEIAAGTTANTTTEIEASHKKADRRWGPKPRVVGVQQHVGGKAARVTFEIECFVFFCSGDISDLESFWWQYSYSFDQNFVCTRTITGKYRLRTPLQAGAEFLPTGSFWPALPSQFFRQSIQHRTAADGSSIEFTITDKQKWRTMPRPITDGTATMRISQQGATIRKNFNCSFQAPIDVDKKTILQFIMAFIAARFSAAFIPPGSAGFTGEFITSLEIVNEEFDNKVSASVSSVRAASNVLVSTSSGFSFSESGAATFFAGAFGDVANVHPGSGDVWTASDGLAELRGMLGAAGLVPTGSPYFDVCGGSAGHSGSISENPPVETYVPIGSAGVEDFGRLTARTAATMTTTGSASEANVFSDDHREFPYIAFTESWQFIVDNNLVVLPVTAVDGHGTPIPDVVQQTASPTIRVIQIGHARRLGAPIDIPQPPFVDNNSGAKVGKRSVRSNSPRVLAGGQLEYSGDWVCEILCPGLRNTIGSGESIPSGESTDNITVIRVPINPQLGSAFFSGSDVAQTIQPVLTVNGTPDEDGTYIANEDAYQ